MVEFPEEELAGVLWFLHTNIAVGCWMAVFLSSIILKILNDFFTVVMNPTVGAI